MVQEMQQRIYLPDSEYEEDREVKDSSLESNRSSSSCSTSDVVSVDDIRKLQSSLLRPATNLRYPVPDC